MRPFDYLQDTIIQSNEKVFQNVYIPRTLDEIYDHEADVAKMRKGENLVYQSVTGLHVTNPVVNGEVLERIACGGGNDGDERNNEEEDDGESINLEEDKTKFLDEHSQENSDSETSFTKKSHLKKDEDRMVKKERKKAVKEEKREARKTKMPKSLKKQKTKIKK